MAKNNTHSQFETTILRPLKSGPDDLSAFIVLPNSASAALPRRGRTSVDVSMNGYDFEATLEPDGQLSHWLPIRKDQLDAASVGVGDLVSFSIIAVEKEPEPAIPADFQQALAAAPEARAVWDDTTTIARVDWIHWIVTAKQAKTRAKRIADACDMLASGKRRVCCFDPSGYYSKALSAPKAAE
ncbi:hypothetical protein CWE12_02565 [Aliidiomarina sedimenti]|uniref:DUF1905 domain-containing protein n=1 Tax=Aliidiomarina sedimenti TaxID=1933879 RepID=A0ABY0C2R4_9GAMM|nr:YdeI/OmpD-associated family protein [Aliidiomarina sedimenti]RUO31898.1 hypothetical protein CWE12_02565 [Aliidiomarina sedimenti]